MKSEPMGVIVQYLEDHGDMTLTDLIDSMVSEEADEVSEESLLGEIKVCWYLIQQCRRKVCWAKSRFVGW